MLLSATFYEGLRQLKKMEIRGRTPFPQFVGFFRNIFFHLTCGLAKCFASSTQHHQINKKQIDNTRMEEEEKKVFYFSGRTTKKKNYIRKKWRKKI